MIVIHIVNGRQPQNNGSLWPPGHKQLHTNVIIEISAGKRKTGKNFEREESANAFITHTPCVRNAKWQKMMKNLFTNQPYQLWPYFASQPPPPQCHQHMLAVCPQQFEGGKKGPRWAEEQTKPNIIRCHRCRHIVCGCSAPRHTYIYIYIHIFPSVYDSPSLVLLFRLGFDDFPQKW